LASSSYFFFFTDPPTPYIFPLSLHDALPISVPDPALKLLAEAVGEVRKEHRQQRRCDPEQRPAPEPAQHQVVDRRDQQQVNAEQDRKSTRLNSSHLVISYAVFCLKKKKKKKK